MRRFNGLLQAIVMLLLVAAEAVVHGATLKPDEKVIMYPALAWRSADAWELNLHGIVYEPERRRVMTRAMRQALGIDEEELSAAERAVFEERCRYFLVDNERGKKFTARLGNETVALGTSAANGHFQSRHRLKTNDLVSGPTVTNGSVSLPLSLNGVVGPTVPLEIHLLKETGLSVVSDIDDTIKISDVLDREALLKNTFCRPFKPVPGMADVYQGWASSLGAQFHYVTASPWQLYLPLSEFARSNRFQAGTFHMKEFRVKDRSVLALFNSPERYKPGVIEPLIRQFPKREWVLVGDSGEKDPEIYGALARKHPRQIRRIFIRDVTSEQAAAPRYQKAFRGVPGEIWQVFRQPAEIKDALSVLAEESKAR